MMGEPDNMADVDSDTELQDLDEIQLRLQSLRDLERKQDSRLLSLLGHSNEMEERMASLQRLAPGLQRLFVDSRELSEMVGSTCALAENVSSKVKELDVAKGRLQETMTQVQAIIDLKACVDGTNNALQSQDFDQAAEYIHRYITFDKQLLHSELTSMDSEAPLEMLETAKETLSTIISERYDEALATNNKPEIIRFFKLFPLLAMHEHGLHKYAEKLCSQVASEADEHLRSKLSSSGPNQKSPVDLLTMLLESIAVMLEQQIPIVEAHYGPGYVTQLIAILQQECDMQSGNIIRLFMEEWSLESTVANIHLANRGSNNPQTPLDPRELDTVLNFLTAAMGRAGLYFKFLQKRVMNDVEAWNKAAPGERAEKEVSEESFRDIQRRSEFNREMQELTGTYITIEEFCLRSNLIKAFSMESKDDPSSLTTTVVDDVFFLASKCVRRACATSSPDCLCAMINHISTMLLTDYTETLGTRLQNASVWNSGAVDFGLIQARVQAGISSMNLSKLSTPVVPSASAVEREAKEQYAMTLNNLSQSQEYTAKFKRNLTADSARIFAASSESDKRKIKSCIGDLDSTANAFTRKTKETVALLCKAGADDRIRGLVNALSSSSYELTEDDLASYDNQSPYIQQVIQGLQAILHNIVVLLLPQVQDMVVTEIAAMTVRHLETVIFRTNFNRLGGLQFDRDLRALQGNLSQSTTRSIRDQFSRLTQLATFLNVDKLSEIKDLWSMGSIHWRITPNELKRVLGRRVDFPTHEIASLRL